VDCTIKISSAGKSWLCLLFFIFFLQTRCSSQADSQLLNDPVASRTTEECVNDIYGFRFSEADHKIEAIRNSYPDHPAIYLLDGIKIYWENFPLLPGTRFASVYVDNLKRCISESEKRIKSGNEAEYLLTDLCARGMLLLFYSDNEFSSEVFPLATSTYPKIRHARNFTDKYMDFRFFTGLFNYYREAYPQAHPIYKTVAFLLPGGDMIKGLNELKDAGKGSLFMKAESYSFLSWIYTNYENDPDLASYYSKVLYELYPGNINYLAVYLKSLLISGDYNEAESRINDSTSQSDSPFFEAKIEIFQGIIQERKYKNLAKAEIHYLRGIDLLSPFRSYSNECTAYGCFGLARIYAEQGKRSEAKYYRRRGLDLAISEKTDLNN
jgi:hypothetical protein